VRLFVLAFVFGQTAGYSSTQDMKLVEVADWNIVTFHFDRTGVSQSRYTIQLQANGLGAYWVGPPDFNLEEAVGVQKITFSPSTIQKAMAPLNVVKEGNCETHLKNIAQTGRKVISFSKESASVNCTFNFSDASSLNDAAKAFQGVAETIYVGEQLQHLLRYDRLGLDAEIDSLVEEVKNGDAIEVQNIAPMLQSLIDDDRVMERVKRKAAHLLEGAGIAVKNYTPEPSAR
jgi:hypothetical protein